MKLRRLGTWAALLLAVQLAAAQTCGNIDARGTGRASGGGVKDDAPALLAMEKDDSIGLIYLPPGTYRLATSLELKKPVFGEKGATFVVERGVTLTLQSQPEYPMARLFDIRDGGNVVFGSDTIRAFPEWFGAVANGVADDSKAVQAAFNAIAVNGNAMLYLGGSYGIGSELTFKNGATIMSETDAKFVAVNGNTKGITMTKGGFAYKNVLPHLSGFSDFCIRFFGSDLGSFQLQTLTNCGDAIRFETSPGDDQSSCLDDTVWFNTITNARVAIAFRAGDGCAGATCVYQGNQVLGNSIVGCAASGLSAAIGFFSGKPRPAWDSNQFNIGSITPCKTNTQYAVLYVNPESETNREVVRLGSVGAVAKGAKLFSGRHNVGQFSINLREEQPEGAGALVGLATLVEFTGTTTPPLGHAPIKLATRSNSKPVFNNGRALLGNYFTLRAVPNGDWAPGDSLPFYLYHQMATGELYHIKCDAPRLQSTGLPLVACVQASDKALAPGGVPNVAEEVELVLINLTGQVIKAGSSGVTFTVAVATLGNP